MPEKDFEYTLARQDNQRETVEKTSQQPVLEQLWRGKWNWIGHTLRQSDDGIDKQVLQWLSQGHR